MWQKLFIVCPLPFPSSLRPIYWENGAVGELGFKIGKGNVRVVQEGEAWGIHKMEW